MPISPVNITPPAISGLVVVGGALTCSPGTWGGSPAPTFTYQWMDGTTNIARATNSSYVIQPSDVGDILACVVTATSTAGVTNATAVSSVPVPPLTAPIAYPFDPTGTASSNLITGEQQILNLPTYENFHFLIPDFAPFFASSMQVSITQLDGTVTPLVEGIDYFCTNLFVVASRGCALPIYGSISFLNLALTGVVSFTYQTLGGIWTISQPEIAQILADTLYNPRVTTWDQVTEQPVTFPPITHTFNLLNLVGAKELMTGLQGISTAISAQTYNTALLTQAISVSNTASTTANQAIITADAALAAANALDPNVAAATLQALQTAISTAEGTLPATLTAEVNNAIATANQAMAAVAALQAAQANTSGVSDDFLYFMGQN